MLEDQASAALRRTWIQKSGARLQRSKFSVPFYPALQAGLSQDGPSALMARTKAPEKVQECQILIKT